MRIQAYTHTYITPRAKPAKPECQSLLKGWVLLHPLQLACLPSFFLAGSWCIAQAGGTHSLQFSLQSPGCEPPCLALFIVLNLRVPAFVLRMRPLFIPAVSSHGLLTAHAYAYSVRSCMWFSRTITRESTDVLSYIKMISNIQVWTVALSDTV